MKALYNTPNILTFSRILFIPIIALSFFFYQKLILFVFIIGALTDFLDGYFARTYKQTTILGQILDPIADKALIATTLFFLAGFQKISHLAFVPTCIILCREVLVSEIRNVACQGNRKIETSITAKWKTAIQMVAIVLILFSCSFEGCEFATTTGEILLWCSAIVAIHSGALYFQDHFKTLGQRENQMKPQSFQDPFP
jgi:cardiolipin synthase